MSKPTKNAPTSKPTASKPNKMENQGAPAGRLTRKGQKNRYRDLKAKGATDVSFNEWLRKTVG